MYVAHGDHVYYLPSAFLIFSLPHSLLFDSLFSDHVSGSDEDEDAYDASSAPGSGAPRRGTHRASLSNDAPWSSSVWATLDDWNDNLEEYPLLSSLERRTGVQKVYLVISLIAAVLALVVWGYGMSLVVFIAGFVVPFVTTLSTISDSPSPAAPSTPGTGLTPQPPATPATPSGLAGLASFPSGSGLRPRGGSSAGAGALTPGSARTPGASARTLRERASAAGGRGGAYLSAQFALRKHLLCYWIIYFLFSTLETVADWSLSWLPFYHLLKLLFLLWCYSPATEGASTLFAMVLRPVVRSHRALVADSYRTTARAAEAAKGSVEALVRQASTRTLQRLRSASVQWVDEQDRARATPVARAGVAPGDAGMNAAAGSAPSAGADAGARGSVSAAGAAAPGAGSLWETAAGAWRARFGSEAPPPPPPPLIGAPEPSPAGAGMGPDASAGASLAAASLLPLPPVHLQLFDSAAYASPVAPPSPNAAAAAAAAAAAGAGAGASAGAGPDASARGAMLASAALSAAARAGAATASALAALPGLARDVKALFTPVHPAEGEGSGEGGAVVLAGAGGAAIKPEPGLVLEPALEHAPASTPLPLASPGDDRHAAWAEDTAPVTPAAPALLPTGATAAPTLSTSHAPAPASASALASASASAPAPAPATPLVHRQSPWADGAGDGDDEDDEVEGEREGTVKEEAGASGGIAGEGETS
jgi:hypothetical protein